MSEGGRRRIGKRNQENKKAKERKLRKYRGRKTGSKNLRNQERQTCNLGAERRLWFMDDAEKGTTAKTNLRNHTRLNSA